MTTKRHVSEHFRLVTPVNTVINTFMLSIIGFFLTQQYFRLDRLEQKDAVQDAAIEHIRGYLNLASVIDSNNLTEIQFTDNNAIVR